MMRELALYGYTEACQNICYYPYTFQRPTEAFTQNLLNK